jgi:hypothetical protein
MNKVNCINYTDSKMDRMNITILKDSLDNYECPYNNKQRGYDNSKKIEIRKQNKLRRISQNDTLSKNKVYSKCEMQFINNDPKNNNHPQFIKNIIIKKDHPDYPDDPTRAIKKLESKYYSDYLMNDDEYNTEEEYEDAEWVSYKKEVQLNYNKSV